MLCPYVWYAYQRITPEPDVTMLSRSATDTCKVNQHARGAFATLLGRPLWASQNRCSGNSQQRGGSLEPNRRQSGPATKSHRLVNRRISQRADPSLTGQWHILGQNNNWGELKEGNQWADNASTGWVRLRNDAKRRVDRSSEAGE